MELRSITDQNVSCCYEISWNKQLCAIIFRIHKGIIGKIFDLEGSVITEHLKRELSFDNFSADFTKDIGFENIFKRTGETQDFVEFEIKIPKVRKITDKTCTRCGGSGKEYGTKCYCCEGSGKEHIYDTNEAKAISASFTAFTAWLSHNNILTDSKDFQLLTFETRTHIEARGNSISGEIGITLRAWLDSLGKNQTMPSVVRAMKSAYEQMMGRETDDFDFRALTKESGGIVLDCPGDSAGIDPSGDRFRHIDQGYEFSSHNMDTFIQQITIIAGLAALLDEARKKIKKMKPLQ